MNTAAIAILREERTRLEEKMLEIDRSIAILESSQPFAPTLDQQPTNGRQRKRGDYKQPYQLKKEGHDQVTAAVVPTVRPGQYKGIEMSAALQMYLLERPGHVPLPNALVDLAAAGTKTISKYANDLNGQARKYLTITIQNNKGIFGFDKKEDTVWLLRERELGAK